MNYVDVIVLVVTILIVFAIIFFSFVLPKLQGKNVACSSCPVTKKGKRLVKDYKKEKKHNCNCCK